MRVNSGLANKAIAEQSEAIYGVPRLGGRRAGGAAGGGGGGVREDGAPSSQKHDSSKKTRKNCNTNSYK